MQSDAGSACPEPAEREVLRRAGYLGAFLVLTLTTFSFAQQPTTAPSLLQQLNTETQSLYAGVRPSLVRVELPPPKWLAQLSDAENPAAKWNGKLNEEMDNELRSLQHSVETGNQPNVQAAIGSSQPTTNPSETHPTRTYVVPRPGGGYDVITPPAQAPPDTAVGGILAPRVQGICCDDAGHVIIPTWIDEETMKDRTVEAVGADGKSTRASFVGSDRATNITVLKLETPAGKPANLKGTRPTDGSLFMLLPPNMDNGRLCIWTGGRDDRGIAITPDGAVAGFVHFGQFLSADAMRPLAQQIIQYGHVRRALLGVVISQAETPDGHYAIHIERVLEDTPAATAGLKQGDYILTLADEAVTDVPSFAAAIALREGRTKLQVLRDGEKVDVTAELHAK